jgi:threonine 3-dehydrogenase
MGSMKAIGINVPRGLWHKTRGFQLMDVPRPQLEGSHDRDSVILKPLFTGVCGSDRNVWYRSAFDQLIYGSMETQKETFRVLGHEIVGKILESGPQARSKGFEPGLVVAVESHIYCGTCLQCQEGQFHICSNDKIIGFSQNGGFAEAVKLPSKVLWKLGSGKIRHEVAAVMEPFGNAVHACSVVPLKGKQVAIFGCGSIGMFTLMIAKAMGAKRVVGIEPDPNHIELSKELGVDEMIQLPVAAKTSPESLMNEDLIKTVRRSFGGQGPDVSFEMAGYNSSVNHALSATRRGGNIILFGIKSGTFAIPDFDSIVMQGKTLRGIVGRRVFETWELAQSLLEDASNQIQEKIYSVLLNQGKQTIVELQAFDPVSFEKQLKSFPKILVKVT